MDPLSPTCSRERRVRVVDAAVAEIERLIRSAESRIDRARADRDHYRVMVADLDRHISDDVAVLDELREALNVVQAHDG